MLLSKIVPTIIMACGFAAGQATDDASDDLSLAIGKINQARQTQGLQPLAWNSGLASYAAYWANQMATGAVSFGHASGQYRPQQGETLFEHRASQCDYSYDNPLQSAANA